MTDPRLIRVFLSSPGDVPNERQIAIEALDQLPYDLLLRGKITTQVIAWDKEGAGTAMSATLTPQEAINRGLAKPSECDIVIVILWSRIGTPFPESADLWLAIPQPHRTNFSFGAYNVIKWNISSTRCYVPK